MELTDGGWYKTPRIIKGKDFLAHIHDTYASGNAMYVEFKASEGEVRILEYQRLYEVDTESAVLFTINTYPQESILLKNIEEYEFFQDEEKNKRYYYNRPAIKLRIVTDSKTGEQKYFLDHIKAIHVD